VVAVTHRSPYGAWLLENGDLLAIGAESSKWADGEAGHRIADDALLLPE
jgi:hypothetical protein